MTDEQVATLVRLYRKIAGQFTGITRDTITVTVTREEYDAFANASPDEVKNLKLGDSKSVDVLSSEPRQLGLADDWATVETSAPQTVEERTSSSFNVVKTFTVVENEYAIDCKRLSVEMLVSNEMLTSFGSKTAAIKVISEEIIESLAEQLLKCT